MTYRSTPRLHCAETPCECPSVQLLLRTSVVHAPPRHDSCAKTPQLTTEQNRTTPYRERVVACDGLSLHFFVGGRAPPAAPSPGFPSLRAECPRGSVDFHGIRTCGVGCRKCRCRESNLGPSDPESSSLTTTPLARGEDLHSHV